MLQDLQFPGWEAIMADPAPVLSKWYAYLMSNRHPLTKDMPLLEPEVCLGFIVAYLLIIWIGNMLMKHREPFNVKVFQLFHNVFQIAFSTYIFYEVLRTAVVLKYKLTCNAVDEVNGKDMAWAVWCFQLAKIFDFNDTFIMVLKKKHRQISFLHVYHHATIYPIWVLTCLFAPGGEAYFSVALNSFIHMVMYTYYLLTSQGVQIPKHLTMWITRMQLIQFCLMFAQGTYCITNDCPYPTWLCKTLVVYMCSMLALFANFFYHRYYSSEAKDRSAARKNKSKKVD